PSHVRLVAVLTVRLADAAEPEMVGVHTGTQDHQPTFAPARPTAALQLLVQTADDFRRHDALALAITLARDDQQHIENDEGDVLPESANLAQHVESGAELNRRGVHYAGLAAAPLGVQAAVEGGDYPLETGLQSGVAVELLADGIQAERAVTPGLEPLGERALGGSRDADEQNQVPPVR